MNGAPMVMNGNNCVASQGAPITATVEFFDLPVSGGPAVKAVRVTANESMPATFIRFLGWMAPGDYTKVDVVARAEAGPERPVDLMLVLDRSGSMGETDGAGRTKFDALKCALTGQGCMDEGFLGENFMRTIDSV